MSRYIVYNRLGYPIDLREHTYAGNWKATNYWNNPLNEDGIFSIPHIRGKYDEQKEENR